MLDACTSCKEGLKVVDTSLQNKEKTTKNSRLLFIKADE